MYQSHPERETLFAGNPANLVEATENVQSIAFDDLEEMHRLVWELAALATEWNPDLIPFFATGGIPYLFPVMQILERQRSRVLIDGQHFHLFPGLAWGGSIAGMKSEEFFASRFGDVIRSRLGAEPLRILAIDTTNTGNAVNNAVAACQKAIAASGASPDRITLRVIGVVNTAHAESQVSSDIKQLVRGADNHAFVLTPSGFTFGSELHDRSFTQASPAVPFAGVPFELAYWVAGNVPTEDRAELIGVEAVHETLSTTSEPKAGRFNVVYRNGETQQGTGLGNLGSRLISLLSLPLDAWQWRKMQDINHLPPLASKEREELAEYKEVGEGFLRLWELKEMGIANAVNALEKLGRLLMDVEVYWLRTIDPPPKQFARKVCASLKKGKCTAVEALKYFRRAFPELDSAHPADASSAAWWMDEIRSMPKEALRRENHPSTLVIPETAICDLGELEAGPIADDERTSDDELALDFVVTAGGIEEARKHLARVKSGGMSLADIESLLDATWPVTADKALTFLGPTNEQVAQLFVLECGGWEEANTCLENWIAKNTGGEP